jgi:hypothetical protein
MTTHRWIFPSASIRFRAIAGLAWCVLPTIVRAAGKYPSPVPRLRFAETLAEQKQELKANALMLRFAESRKRLAADRQRPVYQARLVTHWK